MQQLEIEFFYPLTEQIPLDLDYAPCAAFAEEQRMKMYSNSVLISNGGIGSTSWATVTSNQSLSNMIEFRPNKESVGHWKVSPDLHYYVSKEPNWFVKKMTKIVLGWEWGNKN
jgi:hypothetical protein